MHKKVLTFSARVNGTIEGESPLRPTVGDEFQGVYAQLRQALWASFLLRLAVTPQIDVRFGIARGAVEDLDIEHGMQDGTAWWSAREAVERTETKAGRSVTRTARTGHLAPVDERAAVLPVQSAR